ncbi:MAG: tetratricopeptide repeat protein [Acidobacteria bacterium]|nr:tetratricopeptide repeat protein [Acidobacteriota bacterium]
MSPRKDDNVPPPFDQGVFLIHYNRGKEAFQAGRFGEARKELEAAQKMRPDDAEVLNLLGLVYFRLEAYPSAEFVYEKLLADNPEVFILQSNLGLVKYKLKKTGDAEKHLLKAIELKPNYIRSHLYLGLLYRDKGKLGLALEHLRFAGADRAVEQVEQMMKGGQRGPSGVVQTAPAKAAPPGEQADEQAPAPPPPKAREERMPERPAETAPQPKATPPAAEQRISGVEQRSTASSKPIAPRDTFSTQPGQNRVDEREEAPFPEDEFTRPTLDQKASPPPQAESAAAKLQMAVDPEELDQTRRIDLRKIEGASRTFLLHENGFLEINFSNKVRVKRGTISSYSGNLRFIEEPAPAGTQAATMVNAEGSGRLVVYDRGRQTFLLDLNDEFVFVESRHLLALEQSLSSRPEPIFDSTYQNKLDVVKVYGRGSLAISTTIEPLTLRVQPNYPLSISSGSIVAWTGSLLATVVDDHDLGQFMVEDASDSFHVRFQGSGVVVSER